MARLNDEERNEKILAYLRKGHTYKQAAERYRVKPWRVFQLCKTNGSTRYKKNGITPTGIDTRIDQKRLAKIIKMALNGESYVAIGNVFGVTKQRVQHICSRNGISRYKVRKRVPKDTIDKAARLYKGGYSYSDIAKEIGTTRSAVAGIATRNDFSALRPPR